jgi:hypothetical protein
MIKIERGREIDKETDWQLKLDDGINFEGGL